MKAYEQFQIMEKSILIDVYNELKDEKSYKEIVDSLDHALEGLNEEQSEKIFTLFLNKSGAESLEMFKRGFELACKILSSK